MRQHAVHPQRLDPQLQTAGHGPPAAMKDAARAWWNWCRSCQDTPRLNQDAQMTAGTHMWRLQIIILLLCMVSHLCTVSRGDVSMTPGGDPIHHTWAAKPCKLLGTGSRGVLGRRGELDEKHRHLCSLVNILGTQICLQQEQASTSCSTHLNQCADAITHHKTMRCRRSCACMHRALGEVVRPMCGSWRRAAFILLTTPKSLPHFSHKHI